MKSLWYAESGSGRLSDRLTRVSDAGDFDVVRQSAQRWYVSRNRPTVLRTQTDDANIESSIHGQAHLACRIGSTSNVRFGEPYRRSAALYHRPYSYDGSSRSRRP